MPIGLQNSNGKDPFEAFVDSVTEPREVIQEQIYIPEEPEPKNDVTDVVKNEDIDPVLESKKMEVAMIPAETIVDVIDTTSISINSYIAMEPVEGASEAEKESLQKAFANYLRETNVDISPGKLCMVLVLLIYGPKILEAVQKRKHNIENEALKAENEALRAELESRKNSSHEVPSV